MRGMESNQASHEETKSQEKRWTVWRIDSNANVFAMRDNLTHEEAQRIVEEFTARGHHQHYWAEPDAKPPA